MEKKNKKAEDCIPFNGTAHSYSYGAVVYPAGDNSKKLEADEDGEE